MLLTSSATNSSSYDHPRIVRLRSRHGRDPSRHPVTRTWATATDVRAIPPNARERAGWQTRTPSGQTLDGARSASADPVRPHPNRVTGGPEGHETAAFSAACHVTRATSDAFVAAGI